MNLNSITVPEDFRIALMAIPEREIFAFFDQLKFQETSQMEGENLSERGLTDLQARVKLLNEMRYAFAHARELKAR